MKLFYLFAVVAYGHDMWIEPTNFRPEAGEAVGVKLRVGQDLLGDVIPRNSRAIREFVAAYGESRMAVPGRDGGDPAGVVRGGQAVLGYWSHPSPAELPADKFTSYLREEGLDGILALREKRRESGAAAKERFSRCAKSLLSGAGDQSLGFPLELLAEKNPHGNELVPIRLTYLSRPLAGALVVAINRAKPGEKFQARTDASGRVRLRLPGAGLWMIKAVHMLPAGTAWESYWASLTFLRGIQ